MKHKFFENFGEQKLDIILDNGEMKDPFVRKNFSGCCNFMSNEILNKNIEALKKQLSWLERSFLIYKEIGIKTNYSLEEFDNLEILAGRFTRSIDFLVRKVFRSLDDVEFEDQGTLVDVVNNAHKRKLFNDMEEIREIRDLRNEIVHEYLDLKLKDSFSGLLDLTPKLIEIIKNTVSYSEQYFNK